MFHKNRMSPTIRTNCSICHSILYSNSRADHNRLKYLYPVISVKLDVLHANTKHMAIEFCSWATRVWFLHSWAVHADIQMRMYMHSLSKKYSAPNYTRVHIIICINPHTNVRKIHIHVYLYVYAFVYTRTHIYIYTCMYIYMYIYIYIYVCIYT